MEFDGLVWKWLLQIPYRLLQVRAVSFFFVWIYILEVPYTFLQVRAVLVVHLQCCMDYFEVNAGARPLGLVTSSVGTRLEKSPYSDFTGHLYL
jgi:hypothetical protein